MTETPQKVAVVTGGLVGIGLAISQALLEAGLRVVIGTRRGGTAEARDVVRRDLGPAASIYPLDVRDETSVATFCETVVRDIGEIDILVNSAGVTSHELLSEHALSSWRDVLDTNLTGPFLMMRACLPGMKARGWGRIVNIASTAARTAVADHPAYCASKAGLLGLSRAAALEGAPYGVSCVTVSPTWVETEMLYQSAATMAQKSGRTTEAEIEALAAANPQNRLVQPHEIAALVSFLCSDAVPALTMEDISVNAGAHW